MKSGGALYGVMVLIMVFFMGCSKTTVRETILTEKTRIRLNSPAEAARVLTLKSGFLMVGWKDASIRIIDYSGVEKALYSRKGKGPGELQDCRLEFGGYDKGVLMLADQAQNRIMLFHVDEDEEEISFLNSFAVDKGGISSACFDPEGHILVYTPLGESEYLLYNRDGALLEQWPGRGPLSKRGADDPKDLLRWIGCHDDGLFAVSFLSGNLRSIIAPREDNMEKRIVLWKPRSPVKGKLSRLKKEGDSVSIQGGLSIEGAVITRQRLYVCVCGLQEKGRKEIQEYGPRGLYRECYHLPPGDESENLFLLGIMPGGEFIMGLDDGESGGRLKAIILLKKEVPTEKEPKVAYLPAVSSMVD